MNYRRAKAPGSTFFFTVVTYNRRKIFTDYRLYGYIDGYFLWLIS